MFIVLEVFSKYYSVLTMTRENVISSMGSVVVTIRFHLSCKWPGLISPSLQLYFLATAILVFYIFHFLIKLINNINYNTAEQFTEQLPGV